MTHVAWVSSAPDPEPGWKLRGRCTSIALDPAEDPFYGTDEKGPIPDRLVAVARGLCLTCPVRRDCFIYSLSEREPYGVWAGLTPRERKRVRALFGTLAEALAHFSAGDLFDLVVRP